MDRFIEQKVPDLQVGFKHLKSNMDRFIGQRRKARVLLQLYLKSNMDRFIEKSVIEP